MHIVCVPVQIALNICIIMPSVIRHGSMSNSREKKWIVLVGLMYLHGWLTALSLSKVMTEGDWVAKPQD